MIRLSVGPLLLAGMALLLTQCATGGNTVSDLARTWQEAWVFVPTEDGVRRHEMADPRLQSWRQKQDKIRPGVLYLHGCTGLGRADADMLEAIAGAGFIVIAPDSLARRFRPLQCDPDTKTGGHHLFVYDFRQAEINYALERLRGDQWVDPDRLFLFGASEGGVAAALYRGSAFAGRIITHWTCHGGRLVRGLEAAPDEPILAIVQASDPWYAETKTHGQSGSCGAFMGDEWMGRSIVLRDGDRHDVFRNHKARDAILDFLNQNTNNM